ncbi:TonB-dependent receptor [Chitinophaga sp. MM2321]|uniref:SusC/RagA family TonB-linked outer membrane protein n=1 Tax=Chitinophaga sp. MM2321 TaxID=3137178 RepID=UPI0032D582FF
MNRTVKNCYLLVAATLAMQTGFAASPVLRTMVVQAQNTGVISGIVTAADNGEPLPGVTVRIKGSAKGVLTNASGHFTITVSGNNTLLIFSYTGFDQQEIAVQGNIPLQISLKPASGKLDEVVVVGYGQQKKVNLTGAIASLDQKALANRPITNATQALQGLPGVYVNQSKGRPGADGASIRIRGVGTLNNNDPLVLVDGIEFPLSDINPNDIESVTVLKDAASAAIYGNRAANGVILVKTRTGKAGKFQVDYNGYAGFQRASQLPTVVTDALTYMEGKNRALANEGKPAEYSQALLDEYRNGKDPYIYPNTNWFDVMFQDAPIQEHNLRFSGGNEKTVFGISLGYLDQQGILVNTGAKKYSISSNITSTINSKLKIGANLLGTYWQSREGAYTSDEGNGEGGIMGLIYRGLPMQIPVAQDGSYADQWVRVPGHNFFRNPYALSYEGFRKNNSLRSLANVFAEYQLPFGISYRVTLAVNMQFTREKYAYPQILLTNPKTGVQTAMGNIPARGITQSSKDSINITNYHTLNYDKQLGKHHLGGLLGFSVESFSGSDFTASNQGYLGNEITELNGGSTSPQVNGKSAQSKLVSYFGRFNYDYAGKYLAEASFRYDGSSRFAQGHRWGFFPSLSAGWRISEENFLKQHPVISNLKLRGSWGRLGNQGIPLFSYVDGVTTGRNYNFTGTVVSGAAVTQLSDPNVTWETTTMTDLGLDAGFFRDKLTLEFDVYNKATSNILRQVSVPSQVGNLAGPFRNIGSVNNKGYELTANYRDHIGPVGYNVGANIAFLKNEVTDLRGAVYYDGTTIIREGSPINAFYGLQAIGLFQSDDEIKASPTQNTVTKPGDIKYKDIDNNGIIDNNDRVVIGNSIPKYTYSFVLGLTYKGVELTAFFQGVKDADTYVNGNLAQPYRNGAGVTPEWLTDSWTPENPQASLPRLTTANGYPQNFQTSSFWIQDASYLRLKNIQLSYSLPKRWLQRVHISAVKVFANGQNWLTFSKFKLGDPERNLTRGGLIDYPIAKTATAGINVSF